MGETAEYQRLQEAAEGDYQQLPSDEEEVPAPCLMVVVVEQTDRWTDRQTGEQTDRQVDRQTGIFVPAEV